MRPEGAMAVGLGTVQPRGQVTIPASVRKAAGIRPGDVVLARAVGPGKVELHLIKRTPLRELWARYSVPGVLDEQAAQEAIAQAVAEHVTRSVQRS